MNLTKLMKRVETSHLIMLVAAIVLGYAILNYSSSKSSVGETMTQNSTGTGGVSPTYLNPPISPNQGSDDTLVCGGNYQPSSPMGQNSGPASASGVGTSSQGLPPSCSSKPVVNPAELLPKDGNSEWAKLNPMGAGDLQNVNLLQAGYHIGINTVSSSLRNANLQVRSEPANPQSSVGPWNNTTISPDINRRPLEIGCGGPH